MTSRGFKVVLVAAIVLSEAVPILAFTAIRQIFFTAYPELAETRVGDLPSNDDHCGMCHFRFSGGGPRNAYGQAVEGTDLSVEAILALGGLDSDGDGFTNDEELRGVFLNTPTFPGLTSDNVESVSVVDVNEIVDFLVPEESSEFRRADCNGDGTVDISDAITALDALFAGGVALECDDACDTNDDGRLDISDAIATLNALFTVQGTIPPPGAEACGIDDTTSADSLACEVYDSCG